MNLFPESTTLVHGASSATAFAWHPFRPHLLLALGSRIVVSEGGFLVATLATDDRVDFLLTATSHAFVVALTRSETAFIWNANDYSLVATLSASDGERRGFVAACISAVHPFLFYARNGSRQIMVLDLTSLKTPMTKLDGGRKPAVHVSKPLLATGHADGSVKLWDYQLGTFRGSDEYNSVAQNAARLTPSPAGITMLALHPTQDYVVAATPICLVVAFSVSRKQLNVAAARILNATRASSGVGFLTAIRFHPKLAFLMTTFSKGKIQSWRLVKSATAAQPMSPNTSAVSLAAIDDDKMTLIRSNDFTSVLEYAQLLRKFDGTASHGGSADSSGSSVSSGSSGMSAEDSAVLLRDVALHPQLSLIAFMHERAPGAAPAAFFSQPVFVCGLASAFSVPSCPAVSQVAVPAGAITARTLAADVFYVKRGQLMSFSLEQNENCVVRALRGGETIRVCAAPNAGPVIVLMERDADKGQGAHNENRDSLQLGTLRKDKPKAGVAVAAAKRSAASAVTAHIVARDGSALELVDALDAVFYGRTPGSSFALLAGDGLSLTLRKNGRSGVFSGWTTPIERVFAAPLHEPAGDGLLYFVGGALEFAAVCTDAKSAKPYHPSSAVAGAGVRRATLAMKNKRERVVQVEWQLLGNVVVGMVRTTHRLLVVDEHLRELVHVGVVATSALWCEAVVVFTTVSACVIEFVCVNGKRGVLGSTDDRGASLCAITADRVIFMAPSVSDTQVCALAVWPLEALVHGALALHEYRQRQRVAGPDTVSVPAFDTVDALTGQLDCSRVSTELVRGLLAHALPAHAAGLSSMCSKRVDPVVRLAAMRADGRVADCDDLLKSNPELRSAMDRLQAAPPMAVAASMAAPRLCAAITPEPDRLDAWLPVKQDFYRGALNSQFGSQFSPTASMLDDDVNGGGASVHTAMALGTLRDPALSPPSFLPVPAGFVLPMVQPLVLPNLNVDADCSTLLATKGAAAAASAATKGRVPPPQATLPLMPVQVTSGAHEDDNDSESQASPTLADSRASVAPAVFAAPATSATAGQMALSASGRRAASTSHMTVVLPREDDDVLQSRAEECLGRAIGALEDASEESCERGLADAEAAMEALQQLSDPEDFLDRFDQVSRYKVALSLLVRLHEVRKTDATASDCNAALYATLLASMSLEPKHNLVHLKDAVRDNIAARNFNVAMSLIFHISKVFPAEQAAFSDALALCTNMPRDAQEWCVPMEGNFQALRFCAQTFRIIGAADRAWTCNCCSSIVFSGVADLGSSCPVCLFGTLDE